jgi:hypothetical protein
MHNRIVTIPFLVSDTHIRQHSDDRSREPVYLLVDSRLSADCRRVEEATDLVRQIKIFSSTNIICLKHKKLEA